jgi:arylsulfatase A-like enzyme
MKAIMVMFDSLNRHMLPPYGCDWTHAPNFRRLAERTLTFDTSYICSMPCMPARRDLHTGRPNFLHRSWGPLEPFDDSVPRMLKDSGVQSHLISDHYHYWETGGATYHTQYTTWEFFRGHEGDPWKGMVAEPPTQKLHGRSATDSPWIKQDRINRMFMRSEKDQPQSKMFDAGLDFIRRNEGEDDWFLQIETFDPHEPFFTQRHYQDLYPELIRDRAAGLFDWPLYGQVTETQDLVDQCRGHYAALLSMCDARLGDVLDEMDRLEMWDDTMLIVCTDHGFLLGERDMWAKNQMPWYREHANTPFFVWDPRCGKSGERRASLVQPAIDLGPTLLEFFDREPTKDMLGHPLRATIADDTPVREAAIFGSHGGQINVTDGRFVYMRAANPENQPLYNYTLMPTHMREMFSVEEFDGAQLTPPFSFTKGCPLLRTRDTKPPAPQNEYGHLLFDQESDPWQTSPLQDAVTEQHMVDAMRQLMQACEAPQEQFERVGL